MRWFYKLPLRLRSLFRKARVEQELTDELRFHLEKLIEENVGKGMTADEARYSGLRELGGVEQIKEVCRDMRRVSYIENFLQDARYGLRQLRRSPGFTAVAVLTLALGIGANTAIFTLINAVFLRSVPVANPQQLILLGSRGRSGTTDYSFTYPVYRSLREQSIFLTDLAAFSPVQLNVRVDGKREPLVSGQLVSDSYFSMLGVNATLGRAIGADDDSITGGNPVAMISFGYWKRRFGFSPGAVGKVMEMDGTPFTIIGVTPPGFFGLEVGSAPDVLLPLSMQPQVMPSDENWLDRPVNVVNWLRIVGRLRPGVTEKQALAGLSALYHRIMMEEATNEDARFSTSLREERLVLAPGGRGLSDLRQQFAGPLFILMAAMVLLLLIACANLANLLLARAAARQREIALRLSLGAGPWRVVRQFLVESVLITSLGGAVGIIVASWGCSALVRFMSTGRSAIILDLAPDVAVLLFTGGVSLATGVLFGIAPASWASRLELTPGLNGRTISLIEGTRRWSLGKGFVVSQVALSLVLLIGAGLFARSLRKLNGRDAGLNRESVLLVRLEPKGSDQKRGANATRLNRLYQDLQDRVEAIPGVLSASLAGGSPTASIYRNQKIATSTGGEVRFGNVQVYPEYFKTMGLALLSGRDFDAQDMRENAPKVAVVNETLARAAFPNRNPVGNHFECEGSNHPKCEIIGVVMDARYSNLREDPPGVVYQPFLQRNTGRGQMVLHLRIAGSIGGMREQVGAAVQAMDRTMPAFRIRTLATEVDAAVVRERMVGVISGFFSLLALLMAAIGLYGVIAYTAARRTREIGIRMALGARREDVLKLVVGQGFKLTLVGVAIGIAAAFPLTHFLASMLYGVKPTDPVTFIAASLLLTGVAIVACYVPARRATKVDPMVALRYE